MVPTLIRRPRPKADESLRGFALRVDWENTINLFRKRMKSFADSCLVLADLERATGRSLPALRHRIFLVQSRTGAEVDVFGHIVPKGWVITNVKRVCPECLIQFGYMRATWEVALIKSCVAHNCQLLNRCQSCGRLLSWESGGLFQCSCGSDLRAMKAPPMGTCRVDLDLLISESLVASLEGKAGLHQIGLLDLVSGTKRFFEFAVITGHIAPRIGYAIEHGETDVKDEQQAEFSLRLIRMGRPGIEAAFFGIVGSGIHHLSQRQQANLASQTPQRRLQTFLANFNLNTEWLQWPFVRDVLGPAWELAHQRCLINVKLSKAEHLARSAAADRMQARRLAEHRAQQKLDRELQRRAEIESAREDQIRYTASSMVDERKEFERIREIYRRSPWLVEESYGVQLIWFQDRLKKWGP